MAIAWPIRRLTGGDRAASIGMSRALFVRTARRPWGPRRRDGTRIGVVLDVVRVALPDDDDSLWSGGTYPPEELARELDYVMFETGYRSTMSRRCHNVPLEPPEFHPDCPALPLSSEGSRRD